MKFKTWNACVGCEWERIDARLLNWTRNTCSRHSVCEATETNCELFVCAMVWSVAPTKRNCRLCRHQWRCRCRWLCWLSLGRMQQSAIRLLATVWWSWFAATWVLGRATLSRPMHFARQFRIASRDFLVDRSGCEAYGGLGWWEDSTGDAIFSVFFSTVQGQFNRSMWWPLIGLRKQTTLWSPDDYSNCHSGLSRGLPKHDTISG